MNRPHRNPKTRIATLFTLSLMLGILPVQPGNASDNSTSASGNGIVVPIITKYSSTQTYSCSGALISPLVVATAGHCLLTESGTLSDEIYVGDPGSENTYNGKWAKAVRVYFSEDYQGNTANGGIAPSDIAIIRLTRPIKQTSILLLPSENQLLLLKSSSAKLRVIGYGATDDSGTQTKFPNYYESSFTSSYSIDPNQSFSESSISGPCRGDSGGPVLSITPTKVVLVGIVTGAYPSNACSKRQPNGNLVTIFTVINRFANLVTAAMAESQNAQLEVEDELNARITELSDESSSLEDELELLKQSVKALEKRISLLKSTGMKELECVKGNQVKNIAGLKPVCPAGFKPKKS